MCTWGLAHRRNIRDGLQRNARVALRRIPHKDLWLEYKPYLLSVAAAVACHQRRYPCPGLPTAKHAPVVAENASIRRELLLTTAPSEHDAFRGPFAQDTRVCRLIRKPGACFSLFATCVCLRHEGLLPHGFEISLCTRQPQESRTRRPNEKDLCLFRHAGVRQRLSPAINETHGTHKQILRGGNI